MQRASRIDAALQMLRSGQHFATNVFHLLIIGFVLQLFRYHFIILDKI